MGEVTISVSYIGFEPYTQKISLSKEQINDLKIELVPTSIKMDEVVIKGESTSARVNKTAFNVQSLSVEKLKNTTTSLSGALARMEGVKIRESGGTGSDANITLNGFSGNHVKIFIDGVPQDGSGAFSINNIPAGFAERIEVYSGVVPIEFGSDAIGGVVNIVTGKSKRSRSLWLDASYSYGSFNTHKSYVDFGQQFKNGFVYNINAFQNFSDNDYYVDNYVVEYLGNGGSFSDKNDIQRVQRFNDQFHNESVIAKIGILNKNWADELSLEMNYSQYYKEIQTGAVQDVVFGEKHRRGQTYIPSLRYSKQNLFIDNLDVRFNANYNMGFTQNIDTTAYDYNWRGEKQENTSRGRTNNEIKSGLLNGNLTAKYILADIHEFAISHTLNSDTRVSRAIIEGTNVYSGFSEPELSMKNITGVSYRIKPNEKWNANIFAKNYIQSNEGYFDTNNDGTNETLDIKTNSSLGYGAAGTYFIFSALQSKLSFERAYRLPSSKELFGNGDLQLGNFDLKPEQSYNYNFNLVFNKDINKHNLLFDAGVIYRNTQDYINRLINEVDGTSMFDNHGKVETKGYNLSARYNYNGRIAVGGTFNNLNARDAENKFDNTSAQESLTVGQRIPNQPYIYANADAAYYHNDLFTEKDAFSIAYDLFYQYKFSLHWEKFGDPNTQIKVPTQLSHNVTFNYSLQNGKYNMSFECKNITDANLYDNFSLQKPGRSFYIKLRVNISKYN